MTRARHVAVVARSVFPLHGLGGLERSVYDLVHYLAHAGVEVTLITRPPVARQSTRMELALRRAQDAPSLSRGGTPEPATRTPEPGPPADGLDTKIATRFVPYRTFPLAGRRGTTVLDRSTAYPLFGERAGRAAVEMVERGE